MYLKLFLTFLQIGAFAFGGAYGTISLVSERVLANGWLTEAELLNIIAVSESTPGPITINVATFVGAAQGGIWGSILATVAVVLPSYIVILLVTALLKTMLKHGGVKAFLDGIRPAVVGLIIATSVTMFISTVLGFSGTGSEISVDFRSLIILALLFCISAVGKKLFKRKPSPILMIVISAGLGMLLYSI